ncbi:MAG: hypothetical protein IIA63_01030 [Nitrospinae bacterium]|nr:hypothetical protein [Nitrospinota bacterium]
MTLPNKYQFVMPQYHFVWAVIKVAPHLWFTLVLVWIVVAVSALLQVEVPSAGSVLVCGALIAETMFGRLRWRKLYGTGPSGSFQIKPDPDTGIPALVGDYLIVTQVDGGIYEALLSLSRDHEIRSYPDEHSRWFYINTVERVEKIISWAIIVTAFAGTALWGYGHLLYP